MNSEQQVQSNPADRTQARIVQWFRACGRAVAAGYGRMTAPTPPLTHSAAHVDPAEPEARGEKP
ncbi:MAG: hypothetical protein ABW321_25725 [Polyangiales bacterium]